MPIFVLLVFVGAALLWLLLSFGFIPIGKLSNRLLKDASDAMSKDEKDEKSLIPAGSLHASLQRSFHGRIRRGSRL